MTEEEVTIITVGFLKKLIVTVEKMHESDLKQLNKAILVASHNAIKHDIDDACLMLGIERRTAEIIGSLPINKLFAIAEHSKLLLHPRIIPADTWEQISKTPDNLADVIQILNHGHQNRD